MVSSQTPEQSKSFSTLASKLKFCENNPVGLRGSPLELCMLVKLLLAPKVADLLPKSS